MRLSLVLNLIGVTLALPRPHEGQLEVKSSNDLRPRHYGRPDRAGPSGKGRGSLGPNGLDGPKSDQANDKEGATIIDQGYNNQGPSPGSETNGPGPDQESSGKSDSYNDQGPPGPPGPPDSFNGQGSAGNSVDNGESLLYQRPDSFNGQGSAENSPNGENLGYQRPESQPMGPGMQPENDKPNNNGENHFDESYGKYNDGDNNNGGNNGGGNGNTSGNDYGNNGGNDGGNENNGGNDYGNNGGNDYGNNGGNDYGNNGGNDYGNNGGNDYGNDGGNNGSAYGNDGGNNGSNGGNNGGNEGNSPLDKQEMLKEVNEVRAKAGVPPVELNQKLTDAAQKHSENQDASDKMSHFAEDGSTPSDRVSGAGYNWKDVGENVAWNQPNVKEVMKAWIDSPEHYENLVNPQFKEVGFGESDLYWTQNFGSK